MNLLEVKNICKIYGSGETRCKGAERCQLFLFPKGEYVAIVGESGSGKMHTAEYDRCFGSADFGKGAN
mgnify:CR=1 FL=1